MWYIKRPPQIHLVVYAAVITGFAFLYNARSADFYHPYVRYEPTMAAEATAIRGVLEEALKVTATRRADLTANYRLVPEKISIKSIRPEGGALVLMIALAIDRTKGKEDDATIYFTVPARIGQDIGIEFDPSQTKNESLRAYLDFKEAGMEKLSFLNDGEMTHWKVQNAFGELIIDPKQFVRIQRFLAAYAGFPRDIPGSLGRMFYFSAVTITTVGYGDIVPMTDTARALTATEATIGIILLGLFVTSAWTRASGK